VSVYVKGPAKALFYPKELHLNLNLWHIKWLMKLLALVLFVLSNIQTNLAIWAILLLKTGLYLLAK
jgi:hypothetical protein